jgi:hypothetical protein
MDGGKIMLSIISSFYKGMKSAMIEKDYLKGCYYLLESIAGMIFLALICLIIIACK